MITDPERYRFVADSMYGVATVSILCATCGEAEDADGRIHTFDFLYPSLADVQKVVDEHESSEHDGDTRVLRLAAELVTAGARHGSPSGLKRQLRQDHGIDVSFAEAQALLGRLEAAGVVGPMDGWKHSHPVLLERDEALEALR